MQVQPEPEQVQRCREVVQSRSRGAEVQRCRGERCRGCRGADKKVQRCLLGAE